ncbi:MAG TPA: WecB/TagA/CpsF family glycosyltransferase [Tissierellia bacterium]|nr:WecB/TagA/CpsF family glycosyltransferase [Tissierellia bacterium]
MEKISIFGINIDNITFYDATELVKEYLNGNTLKAICTPNTEIVMAARDDAYLKNLINGFDLIIPDGIGLIYGSRIRKKPLKERVTGFDLSVNMLEIADEKGYSIFLLGGKEGVAKKASENIIKKYPNIKIAGVHNGYFKGSHNGYKDHDEEMKVIEMINSSKPDIIFVGLGFPKQEIWISENRHRIYGKVIIGNGGTMDILSGNAKRAPVAFQRLGLEWLYRLMKEPSRIRRQMALPKFILAVIFNREAVQ